MFFDIKEKIQVLVQTEYESYDDIEDVQDEDVLGGEYSGINIYIDNKLFLNFGDYYHDKGDEKAEAVIETLQKLFGDKKVVVKYDEIVVRK